MIDLHLGDCREFEDAGLFHALLCDPPYELGFMGRDWDKSGIAFNPETWAKLAEHLYDGAFGMAFASSRGWHRLACAIEDAGLIIHPSIFGWAYGSGFPKATRIDTAIDKAAGATQEIIGPRMSADGRCRTSEPSGGKDRTALHGGGIRKRIEMDTAPATPLAATWAGHRYGLQALKPALEPIIVFQKPYRGKPIECITRTGAGALNIDAARIVAEPELAKNWQRKQSQSAKEGRVAMNGGLNTIDLRSYTPVGRWPANFILLDDEAAQALDAQSGELKSGFMKADTHRSNGGGYSGHFPQDHVGDRDTYGDSGGASRFFFRVQEQIDDADPVYYTAKASRRERDAGLDEWKPRDVPYSEYRDAMKDTDSFVSKYPDGTPRPMNKIRNPHPTVKPIALARYLATLLLPPAEYAPRRLLVPFAGVGSEMIGAMLAGWEDVTGIERGAEYVEIGQARIAHWCGIPIAQAQIAMPMVTA